MRFPKISLTFLILLSAAIPFTFVEGASIGALQEKEQLLASKITVNPLLAQKQQPESNQNQAEDVFEVKYLPTASMEPTIRSSTNLKQADWILVDKFAYRSQLPKRGDLVLFEPTEELRQQEHRDLYIKRIIALPGEQVELKNGKVYINNQLLQENYLSPTQLTSVDICTSGQQPPFLSKPQIIPSNSYLVLGDNRTQSYDGRCWGVVERKNIVSQAVRIVMPPMRKRELDETRNSQQRQSENLFLKQIGLL
ncbi:signal peptidase I [Iningainema tapete]|uniref:Signal peptidase I n=2 Tax=Iningainema TaxID=1932705 RepID=A0A8J6XKG2_9CYAN|nr:signal peptidase I [Iningainema tapete BLCC-T55]